MHNDFKEWAKKSGMKIAAIGATLSAIQAAIAPFMAFPELLHKVSVMLPSASHLIQAGFTAGALGLMIGMGYKEEQATKRGVSLARLFRLWVGVLICWTIFKLLLVCQDLQILLPDVLTTGWFLNLINRAPTLCFFAMYGTLCDRWALPSTRLAGAILIASCIVFTVVDAAIEQQTDQVKSQLHQDSANVMRSATLPTTIPTTQFVREANLRAQQATLDVEARRVQLLSSAVDFLILAMFVSRLDSKIFAFPPAILWTMYIYPLLQLLISVADLQFSRSLMAVTFIVKAVLIVAIIWLFDTPTMSLFLRRIRELADAAPEEIAKATQNALPRRWNYPNYNGD